MANAITVLAFIQCDGRKLKILWGQEEVLSLKEGRYLVCSLATSTVILLSSSGRPNWRVRRMSDFLEIFIVTLFCIGSDRVVTVQTYSIL